MTRYEIVRFWGETKLRRWPRSIVETLALPQAVQNYLADVGLPTGETWLYRFNSAECDLLPRVAEMPSLRVVGFDDCVPICLDESNSGSVWNYEVVISAGLRFINSDIEQFGEFLLRFSEYRQTVRGVEEETDAQRIIDRVERLMRDCDPAAFEIEDSYWNLMMLEMRSGNQ